MNTAKVVLLALLLAVTVFSSGCMQILQEIKVYPDGTGMMAETVKLSPMVAQIMAGFAEGMSGSGGPKQEMSSPDNLFPEEQFREKAQQMGEGVEFLSREVREFEEEMVGYVATYKINSMDDFTLNPQAKDPTMETPGTNTPITFAFKRGTSSSSLKIRQHFPTNEVGTKKEVRTEPPVQGGLGEADEKQMAQFAEMMKGMRVQIVVECGNEIERTNAKWRDGNRIVLVDFDMEELFSHPEKLQMLSQMQQPQSKEDLESLLQGIEGIKFDASEEIEVIFR